MATQSVVDPVAFTFTPLELTIFNRPQEISVTSSYNFDSILAKEFAEASDPEKEKTVISAVEPAIDVNDPIFNEIQEDIVPEPLKDPQAIRLSLYACTAHKARKLEDCGRVAVMLRDDAGHTWRQRFHCHERFCPRCTVVSAKNLRDRLLCKFSIVHIDHPEILKCRFIQVSWSAPENITPKCLKWFQGRITQAIATLKPSGSASHLYLWPERQSLEARVIILGDYDIYMLVAAFRDMTIQAHSLQIGQLDEYVEDLVSGDIPATPEARGDAEYIADGTHLFKATGVLYGRRRVQDAKIDTSSPQSETQEVDLFTEEESTTVNKSSRNWFTRCPQCGKKAVEVSETFSLDARPPDPANLRWRPIG